jgi:hypothetical protein
VAFNLHKKNPVKPLWFSDLFSGKDLRRLEKPARDLVLLYEKKEPLLGGRRIEKISRPKSKRLHV